MPMGGMPGKGAMPMEAEIFGAPGGGPMDVPAEELDAMFAEEDMGMGDPQTMLMDSLISAGFSPTPEQVTQILEILQGGGIGAAGVMSTEGGMEAVL